MSTSRGRQLSELRRSNAAGIHVSTAPRSQKERNAIKEELMSEFDGDYELDDDYEPTEEDLAEAQTVHDEAIHDSEIFGENWNAEEYYPGDDEDDDFVDYDPDEYRDDYDYDIP